MVREQPGVLSGTVSLCETVASTEEVLAWGVGSGDDTRQDPPLGALSEADSGDPGGQRRDDTRRDPAAKTEPAHLCGRWVWIERDTRQDRHGVRVSLKWNHQY